jgi:hypothetical protein
MTQPTIDFDVKINGFLEISELITIGSVRQNTILSQIGTMVIGTLGDFIPAMQGGVIQYADNTTAFIVAFINSFSLTVSPSQTKSQQTTVITFGGLQLDKSGASVNNVNTTNLITVTLSATNINAFNDITAGNNITAAGALNSTTLNITGNATVGGSVTIVGPVNVTSISASGNITAGGTVQGFDIIANNDITAGATIQGTDVTATANITAGAAVQGNVVNATTTITAGTTVSGVDIIATNTVSATDISASNQITSDTLTTTGVINTPNIIVGGGGIQSAGNISSTNGAFTTVNGNISTTNGNIQGNNITATGTMSGGNLIATSTFTSPSASFPSILTQKGQILGTNGVGGAMVAVPIGSNGSPVLYDSTQSTGLSSTQPHFFQSSITAGLFTGGVFSANIYRTGMQALLVVSAIPTFTNTGGVNAVFIFNFSVPNNFTPNFVDTKYAIQIIINGVTQAGVLQINTVGIGSLGISVSFINDSSPNSSFLFPPGDTIAVPQVVIPYICIG